MRDDAERLRDIMEAVERVERYTARGREAFDGDELIQSWLVRHLEVIGEAGLSTGLREANPDVPWRSFVGIRNVLIHQYFGIALDPV